MKSFGLLKNQQEAHLDFFAGYLEAHREFIYPWIQQHLLSQELRCRMTAQVWHWNGRPEG